MYTCYAQKRLSRIRDSLHRSDMNGVVIRFENKTCMWTYTTNRSPFDMKMYKHAYERCSAIQRTQSHPIVWYECVHLSKLIEPYDAAAPPEAIEMSADPWVDKRIYVTVTPADEWPIDAQDAFQIWRYGAYLTMSTYEDIQIAL